ncbi:hypothetical protein N9K81_03785, partial [Candidatus Poseidoniales archaeon]|nr:hypothetical protein [Candidatus Poseidoniales archaeon]
GMIWPIADWSYWLRSNDTVPEYGQRMHKAEPLKCICNGLRTWTPRRIDIGWLLSWLDCW